MHSVVTKLWGAVQHMIDGIIGRPPELIVALIVFFVFYILSGFVSAVSGAGLEEREHRFQRRQNEMPHQHLGFFPRVDRDQSVLSFRTENRHQ